MRRHLRRTGLGLEVAARDPAPCRSGCPEESVWRPSSSVCGRGERDGAPRVDGADGLQLKGSGLRIGGGEKSLEIPGIRPRWFGDRAAGRGTGSGVVADGLGLVVGLLGVVRAPGSSGSGSSWGRGSVVGERHRHRGSAAVGLLVAAVCPRGRGKVSPRRRHPRRRARRSAGGLVGLLASSWRRRLRPLVARCRGSSGTGRPSRCARRALAFSGARPRGRRRCPRALVTAPEEGHQPVTLAGMTGEPALEQHGGGAESSLGGAPGTRGDRAW